MNQAIKQIQKTRILNSNIFIAIFKQLNENEKKLITDLTVEELKEIIKYIYHKLSVQKDVFIV